jgi:hypothetical protein
MFGRIFPKQFDNTYRGHWLAIWLFVPVVLLKATQGANIIFNTRLVAIAADGISLDSLGATGAETFLALFAVLGLYLLVLALQCVLVLIRYRAMIPFMYLLLLIVQIGGIVLLLVHPIVRTGGMPIGVPINRAALAMTLIGFVLSLVGKGYLRGQETKPA